MNRTQTACFALLASAFVLSAILVVQLDQKAAPNAAQADGQNVTQTGFQMMTAVTRNDDESLFILDSNNGKLVVYSTNIGNKQMKPIATMKMSDVFGGGGGRRPR